MDVDNAPAWEVGAAMKACRLLESAGPRQVEDVVVSRVGRKWGEATVDDGRGTIRFLLETGQTYSGTYASDRYVVSATTLDAEMARAAAVTALRQFFTVDARAMRQLSQAAVQELGEAAAVAVPDESCRYRAPLPRLLPGKKLDVTHDKPTRTHGFALEVTVVGGDRPLGEVIGDRGLVRFPDDTFVSFDTTTGACVWPLTGDPARVMTLATHQDEIDRACAQQTLAPYLGFSGGCPLPTSTLKMLAAIVQCPDMWRSGEFGPVPYRTELDRLVAARNGAGE